ncbi:folate-binding protein YgfZ [Rhodomicrobium vannielii ATCC 17100]|uniref:Folate-binding protein YgfZ n=1 Tax=Rhodomicrobium vannielii (strain ATCC 17100 / DSM 162 / LMG 4299 / NCIMB 10020 / ATH 3.1.1) TaxID=648757 RepID=E3I146_RHOVT|nr:folate-binding protein YgfZ [Rhodomicrobium vannielii]ADP70059.1 folate-binding protein YgfZ [Rhodomicrobium vannielii ATCC 17100]
MPSTLLPDRAVLKVTGDDHVSFLHGLITNDVEHLGNDEARFSGLLSPQGKILFDFFVVRHGDTHFIDAPKAQADALLKRLTMYKLRAKVDVADVSDKTAAGAIWGEDAAAWAKANGGLAYADPRLPELGSRILISAAAAPAVTATPEDYAAHRIALAVPEGGADYAFSDAFPHEACFDFLHGMDFKKGCFVGQEVVSRMQHRGTARTRVLSVTASADLPEGGADIVAGGFPVGRLGSVYGAHGVALARIDRVRDALAKGLALTVGAADVDLTVPHWATYSLEPEPAGDAA